MNVYNGTADAAKQAGIGTEGRRPEKIDFSKINKNKKNV
jgi:hypothetical protein